MLNIIFLCTQLLSCNEDEKTTTWRNFLNYHKQMCICTKKVEAINKNIFVITCLKRSYKVEFYKDHYKIKKLDGIKI